MLESAKNTWTVEEAAHLLNRAGFGGSPSEIRRLHRMGRLAAVDSLLNPPEPIGAIPAPAWAGEAQVIADMKRRVEERRELHQSIRNLPLEEAEERKRVFRKKEQQETQQQIVEAQAWWFRRMLHSKAPLREKMTLFWHDHFATSIQKVREPVLIFWQNATFREHAFGNFHQLATSILRDPAMMLYLDTQNSKKGRPNENFARELMELFTLGEGHYQEEDVRQAARAFTGYQLNRSNGKVFLNSKLHDAGEITIFGKTGAFTGEQVIDLIFERDRPSVFLAGKIWEFFVGLNPPPALVKDLAATMRGAGWELRPMLRRLFLSKEFYAPKVVRNQIKSPIQFLVQLLKQLEISKPPPGFPMNGQQQLGQVLFMPPNVAGWDWGKAWINTNTLLARYNLAGTLTRIPGAAKPAKPLHKPLPSDASQMMNAAPPATITRWNGPDYEKIVPTAMRANPQAVVDALAFRFFNGPTPEKADAIFLEFATNRQGGGISHAEIGELCHLMLSTPSYQLV